MKNNKLYLKNGLMGVAALVLGFGPFVTASGGSGIDLGTFQIDLQGSQFLIGQPSFGQEFGLGALSDICATTPSSAGCFNLDLNGIDGTSLQGLSPQAAIQADTVSITSPYQFVRSMNQRMERLFARDSSANIHYAKKQSSFMLRTSSTTGAPSADAYGFIGPFGISISGGGGFGNRNNAQGQTGFRLNTRQANLMIDYSFNQKLIGGFSFGYLGTDRNMKLNNGNLNSDSYRFAPFLVFRPTTNSYLNLMGGYSLINYRSTRSVPQSGGVIFNGAKAKYNADQFFVSLGGGYTLTLKDGWNLRGYGRGDYSNTHIDSFQESDTGGSGISSALQVNGQNIRSVTSTVGAELSHAISTRTLAAVIIPRIRAEWVHEFENDARVIGASALVSNATPGALAIAGPQRDWANLSFGLNMLFSKAIVGHINYNRLIIKHANHNVITGGIRMNF